MADENLHAACYLTLGLDNRGGRRAKSLTIRNMTKNKPSLSGGEFAIRVNIELPAAVFDQVIPEATIALPKDKVHLIPIVTADGVPILEAEEDG